MGKLSAEAEEDSLRGIDYLERHFGFEAVQRLQAATDPETFDIRTFMLGMALRMAAYNRQDIRRILGEFRVLLKP